MSEVEMQKVEMQEAKKPRKITLSQTREYVAEYNKKYHDKKRQENIKISCVCGKTVSKNRYEEHLKTKYHLIRITNNNNKELEEIINNWKKLNN